MRRAMIVGLAGEVLGQDERLWLAQERPAGLILFARNCGSAGQIRALVDAALAAIGGDETLVLIDQEGGRVQRLRPPQWRALPPAAAYARLASEHPEAACQAAHHVARLTAAELRLLGINTNCAPVLDLTIPGAHEIIGDRAYGATPVAVAALAGAVAQGYIDGGVVPVMKHIPGHGRARADSHLELPVVDTPLDELERTDFEAFRLLAHLPAAMTAHVVYPAIDSRLPASVSSGVIADVIRGSIGFDGLLMCDDIGMQALSGSYRERARSVLAAGCDVVLHCSGDLAEARSAAEGTPALSGVALARFERALAVTRTQKSFDATAAEAALAEVMSRVPSV